MCLNDKNARENLRKSLKSNGIDADVVRESEKRIRKLKAPVKKKQKTQRRLKNNNLSNPPASLVAPQAVERTVQSCSPAVLGRLGSPGVGSLQSAVC